MCHTKDQEDYQYNSPIFTKKVKHLKDEFSITIVIPKTIVFDGQSVFIQQEGDLMLVIKTRRALGFDTEKASVTVKLAFIDDEKTKRKTETEKDLLTTTHIDPATGEEVTKKRNKTYFSKDYDINAHIDFCKREAVIIRNRLDPKKFTIDLSIDYFAIPEDKTLE